MTYFTSHISWADDQRTTKRTCVYGEHFVSDGFSSNRMCLSNTAELIYSAASVCSVIRPTDVCGRKHPSPRAWALSREELKRNHMPHQKWAEFTFFSSVPRRNILHARHRAYERSGIIGYPASLEKFVHLRKTMLIRMGSSTGIYSPRGVDATMVLRFTHRLEDMGIPKRWSSPRDKFEFCFSRNGPFVGNIHDGAFFSIFHMLSPQKSMFIINISLERLTRKK